MHLKHWQMPLKEQEMQNNDSLLCASLCARFLVVQVLADLVVLNSLLFYHRPSCCFCLGSSPHKAWLPRLFSNAFRAGFLS